MTKVKTVWVQANFKELGKWITKQVQVGTEIRIVEKGFFNKKQVQEEIPVLEDKQVWEVVTISDKEIDGERLSSDIEQAVAKLQSEGYEVSCIVPVISGQYNYNFEAPVINAGSRASYGWGYGFSFTEGVTIVGSKMENL